MSVLFDFRGSGGEVLATSKDCSASGGDGVQAKLGEASLPAVACIVFLKWTESVDPVPYRMSGARSSQASSPAASEFSRGIDPHAETRWHKRLDQIHQSLYLY